MGIRWREIGAVLTGCILMILSSAANVWIVIGIRALQRVTYLDVYYVNIINALLPVGTVAGTIIFSIAAELVGRKITLLAVSAPYAIAFIIFQFAESIPVACVGRVLAGLGVGGSHVVLPIYIAEIAEPSYRGVLGSLVTVSSLIGVLGYYVITTYATYTVYNIVAVALAIVFFFSFLFIGIESPYYYIRKHRNDVKDIIFETKLGEEISDPELTFVRDIKIMRCLGSSPASKSLIMMTMLILLHHLSGVSMIPMLLHYITAYLGSKDIDITYNTVLFCSVGLELLGSLICTALVDTIGRKACLIISTICVGIFYIPVAVLAAIRERYIEIEPIPAITILFVVMFLIFFYVGLAPIPQVLLGELFPPKLKMVAAAFIVSFQQVTFFVVANYFQQISSFIGYLVILFIFLGSMWLAPLLIYFGIVETKGRSLQEIQIILKNK